MMKSLMNEPKKIIAKKKKKTKILNSPLPQVIKVGYVIYVGRVALMLE